MVAYPEPKPEKALPTTPVPSDCPQEWASAGYVPLDVVGQALNAIPPITGQGRRQEWLALAFAVKAANPEARHLFDQWQHQSPEYDKSDAKVWDTIDPEHGSYPNLFAQAAAYDPNWWRCGSVEVEMWWRRHIADVFGNDDAKPPPDAKNINPTIFSHRFQRHKMSDLKNRPTPKWLIRNLIFQQQIGLVYAPPGSFKSFVALDLCTRLAHGMEWHGKNLKPCRVLYVAGEGFPMFYNRRLAWFRHHSIPIADDGVEVVGSSVDLTSSASVAAFIVEMQLDSDGMGLIVFDTLSTCTAGKNESDSAVMTAAIENAKLIGSVLGAAVLLIHHPGKDIGRGARGHSSLNGNVDTEWLITRSEKDMHCRLKVTKQKDAEDGQIFDFAAHRVPLGILDDDCEEMFSLAVTPCEERHGNLSGEILSAEEADRLSVACAMQPDQPMTLNELAPLVAHALGKRTSAIKRIKAAIPEEWTRTRLAKHVAEIHRIEGANQSQVVEMRLLSTMPSEEGNQPDSGVRFGCSPRETNT